MRARICVCVCVCVCVCARLCGGGGGVGGGVLIRRNIRLRLVTNFCNLALYLPIHNQNKKSNVTYKFNSHCFFFFNFKNFHIYFKRQCKNFDKKGIDISFIVKMLECTGMAALFARQQGFRTQISK